MPKAITPGVAVHNNSHPSFLDRYVFDFTRYCSRAKIQVVCACTCCAKPVAFNDGHFQYTLIPERDDIRPLKSL
jgi:hypothetical protein